MTETNAQLLLERLPLVTYTLQREAPSPVAYVSPQIEAFFDFGPDELARDPEFLTKRIFEEDRQAFTDATERLRSTGEPMAVEYRVVAADGRTVWVRDSATADGDLLYGCLLDVTREKALEIELGRQRAALDAFFEQSSIGLAISDSEGRYIKLNEALAALNGVPLEENLGRTLQEVAPEVAALVDPLRVAAREGIAERFDIEMMGPEGPQHVLLSYFPFSLGDETYHGRVVVDVTEERRAQAAERELRLLLEALPLAAYTNDLVPERRARYVSPKLGELTGYPPDLFLSDESLSDRIIHPDDFATIDALEAEARGTGTSFEHVYRIVRADGSIRWVLDRMDTIFDAQGEPKYEQGFLVDITERHEAESLLRAILDGAYEGITVADERGCLVDANPAACELFGRSHEELVGLSVDEIVGRGSYATFVEHGPRDDYTILRPDGTTRDVEVAARSDVLPGLHVTVLRDVTERKRLERELWRAQRLESVGRLAGGVAQDFNNLLTAIRGYAQLLQARVPPGSVEHHHAAEIDRVADRAAALTAQLLALGRRQMLKARPLDLNRYLESRHDLLVELAGPGTELVCERDPAVHAVRADPSQIEQVLISIATNAVEAVDGGGRIVVRTFNAELDGADDLPAGRYAVLSVTDDGRGIDETALEHVFEPFFTTKEVGEGSGLGLASAYGIARQSGGTIRVSSIPGAGSTFSVFLPEAGAGGDERAAPGNGETLLVVERDPAVRDVLFELLTDARYRVVTAPTSVDALRLAETFGGPIDLVLADVDDARRELLETTLRTRRPALRALALPKPYTPDRLQRALRDALDSPARVIPEPVSG
jgi:two-component system, cell cycle sensor histidine kinase and response regulator CckA